MEFPLSAGAQQILFVNGAGSLRPDLAVGSILLPGELLREDGTSFHFASTEGLLDTDVRRNERLGHIAGELVVRTVRGGRPVGGTDRCDTVSVLPTMGVCG
jgi:uridine phosphorylase